MDRCEAKEEQAVKYVQPAASALSRQSTRARPRMMAR